MKLLRIALITLCLSAGLPFVGTAARPERYPEIRVKTPEVKMRLKRMNRKHPVSSSAGRDSRPWTASAVFPKAAHWRKR